jgi:hypothetical protein
MPKHAYRRDLERTGHWKGLDMAERKRGRAPRPVAPGTTGNLGLRVPAELKALIDGAAAGTGRHRKHAIRVLAGRPPSKEAKTTASRRRAYDDAFRKTLIVLWEARNRICAKRLEALIPTLVAAMERHRHLELDAAMQDRALRVSAATIDRLLTEVRAGAGGDAASRPRSIGCLATSPRH